jgi:glycosyltransferase involved in cell wall biosynthesis
VVVDSAEFTGRERARARRWSDRVLGRFDLGFLDSYDTLVANSPYTAGWVNRLWSRPAEVLAPPVVLRQGGAKRPMILAVGRFFPDTSGHSKKQLELVEAFRRAHASGLDGWELCLAGGCAADARAYVEDVRTAAVGLPVRFFVNARGEDLDELFAGASVFWHAAGYGEDPERNPDRFEHFGISVIEGMSAGAVPVVFAVGGPAAVVEPGRTGEHFRTLDELASVTRALAADDDRRARLAEAAVDRARGFSPGRFRERVHALVASMHA